MFYKYKQLPIQAIYTREFDTFSIVLYLFDRYKILLFITVMNKVHAYYACNTFI